MSATISILIADDHPVVRDGLAAILSTQPDFEVIGEAASGAELVEQASARHPDVILTDLEMPGMDGVEAIRQLRQTMPDARVIVLTAFDTDDRIIGAIEAGARGYLLKGVPRADIFHAIRVVGAGGSLLQPIVASRLLQHISGASQPAEQPLTPRELDVLGLLAQGKVNKEIATALSISERTVKFHVSAILAKLGAGNRTEAVVIATQRGLIER